MSLTLFVVAQTLRGNCASFSKTFAVGSINLCQHGGATYSLARPGIKCLYKKVVVKLGQHPAKSLYIYMATLIGVYPLDLPLKKTFPGKPERYPWYVEGPESPQSPPKMAYIHNYTIPKPPWNSHKLILNIAGLEEQFLLQRWDFHVPAVAYRTNSICWFSFLVEILQIYVSFLLHRRLYSNMVVDFWCGTNPYHIVLSCKLM